MGCVCTKKSIRIDGVNYAIVEHIGDGWVFTILWINGKGSNQNKGGLHNSKYEMCDKQLYDFLCIREEAIQGKKLPVKEGYELLTFKEIRYWY